jgi:hypothetical protein
MHGLYARDVRTSLNRPAAARSLSLRCRHSYVEAILIEFAYRGWSRTRVLVSSLCQKPLVALSSGRSIQVLPPS